MTIKSRRLQSGMAIVTAVAIAALVAALASFMAWRYSLWFRQVENQHDLAQARVVAKAALDLARLNLQADARRSDVIDHAKEPWAIPIAEIPVERGVAGGRNFDAQGRFNLNNLIDIGQGGQINGPALEAYVKLLGLLQLPPELANSLADWVDSDKEPREPGGAEEMYYLGLPQPYRPPDRMLLDTVELGKIRGYTPEVLAKLEPYVTALPLKTAVNLNFASPEVIAAVVPELDVTTAKTIVAKRDKEPFKEPAVGEGELTEVEPLLPSNVIPKMRKAAEGDNPVVSLKTSFFYADVNAKFGRVTVNYRALLRRKDDQVPEIIWLKRR